MTIYVIRADDEYADISCVTDCREKADFWRTAGRFVSYVVTEQVDPTVDELSQVEALKNWLVENYERGAHWVYETTDTLQYVVDLRGHGGDINAYKADLERHWEVVEDYACDIRNA